MIRENKVGLIVCGAFLSLVATVTVMKLREKPAADAPSPNSPTAAIHSEPPALDKGNDPPKSLDEPRVLEAPAPAPATLPDPVPLKVAPAPLAPPSPTAYHPEPPAAPAPALVLGDPTPPPSGLSPASAPGDSPGPLPPPPPPPSALPDPPDPPMQMEPPAPPPPPSDPPGPVAAPPVVVPLDPPAPPPVIKIDDPPPAPPVKVEPLPLPVKIQPPAPAVVSPPAPPPPTIKIDTPTPPAAPPDPPSGTPVIKIDPPAPPDNTPPAPSTVIKIPAAALPTAPPAPGGDVIASTSPGAAPLRPAPTASTPLVDSWDERTYVCKAGEDFASICKREYRAEEYAAALQMYNRNHPRAGDALRRDGTIGAGDRIYLPPSAVLERRHSDVIPKPKPKPVAVGAAVGESGAVQAGFQTPIASTPPPPAPTYTVKTAGERLFQIADQQLHNGNRWNELAQLNPDVNTEEPVPVGKVLKMPAGFTAAPAAPARPAPAVPVRSAPPAAPPPPLPGS